MRKFRIFLMVTFLSPSTACSPRDFLTRRLAADLIAGSETFKATQQFSLRTGIVSNKDYLSPEYLVLRRQGWITGSNVACAKVAPPPCWEVALSPIGVETFRGLIPSDVAVAEYISVPVARRQLLAVTDISKNGNVADVDFQWKWVPVNEVGAALYSGGVPYNSTVGFRHYDDGWRLLEGSPPKSNQDLDDALKNAEPVQ
jgi:hypothetical protein